GSAAAARAGHWYAAGQTLGPVARGCSLRDLRPGWRWSTRRRRAGRCAAGRGGSATDRRARVQGRPSAHQQPVEQPLPPSAVRRIDQPRRVEARLAENASGFAEGEEAFVAVIVAHAGRTDAAERQVILGHVQQRVVEADAAG